MHLCAKPVVLVVELSTKTLAMHAVVQTQRHNALWAMLSTRAVMSGNDSGHQRTSCLMPDGVWPVFSTMHFMGSIGGVWGIPGTCRPRAGACAAQAPAAAYPARDPASHTEPPPATHGYHPQAPRWTWTRRHSRCTPSCAETGCPPRQHARPSFQLQCDHVCVVSLRTQSIGPRFKQRCPPWGGDYNRS